MNDIKSFVLLKYEMITSNSNTWNLCEKYPESVNKRWALRCARDVEHLDKTGKAKKCNDLNERYQNVETELLDELVESSLPGATSTASAYYAYYAASAAARLGMNGVASYAASCDAANKAATASSAAAKEDKWKQYIDWLIEELCEYEINNDKS